LNKNKEKSLYHSQIELSDRIESLLSVAVVYTFISIPGFLGSSALALGVLCSAPPKLVVLGGDQENGCAGVFLLVACSFASALACGVE
jgi:hypothetical protein